MSLTEEQRAEVETKVNRVVGRWLSKCPPHVDRDDAMSAAWEGVCKAANRYNGKNGASFATYACIVAKGAMIDWFRKEHQVSRRHRILRVPIEWDEVSPAAYTPEYVHGTVLPEHTLKLLQEMPEQTRLMLMSYFGDGCTQVEVAAKYGMSEARVSQVLNLALLKLKAPDYEQFVNGAA
jgi:RNA polymerase sigma factor (sigma-70 family)